MIVYSATKAQFNDDVNLNRISDIILQNLREKNISGGQLAEYNSWQNCVFCKYTVREMQWHSSYALSVRSKYLIKRRRALLAGCRRQKKRGAFLDIVRKSNDQNGFVIGDEGVAKQFKVLLLYAAKDPVTTIRQKDALQF